MNFREKMMRWMQGRNGMDDLARFESILVWILLIISLFVRNPSVYLLTLALIIHMYFRVFSKNLSKRCSENQAFRNWRYQWNVKLQKTKRRLKDGRTYKYFRCPMCKQKIRVPRGHGKICVICPKCREEFIKRT